MSSHSAPTSWDLRCCNCTATRARRSARRPAGAPERASIKAIQIAGAGDVRGLERYHVDFHLADARARSATATSPAGAGPRGGTGETFDWSLLSGRRSRTPLILSGGLRPDNVAGAVERVHPYAVDTASGTERAPGHKDEAKLRAFFDAIASTRAEAAPTHAPAPDALTGADTAPVDGAPVEGAAA